METTLRNRVQLMGHLGADPELRELDGGKRMARMRLATNERFTFGNGQTKDDVQWHSLVAWGRVAERAYDELRKGSRVAIEGRLVHRVYETKDGQKRYVTEVVVNNFELPVTERAEPAAA